MERKTIQKLSEMNGRVYVRMANREIGKEFMQQAETEGFTFPDGAKPTERCCEEIMSVTRDKTINFVGTNGRIAFGSGVDRIGDEVLIRVDYGTNI